jgi:gluconolactonase
MDFEIVCEGLQFPEGPVAMADGSVLLVEIRNGRLTRVSPNGKKETVAEVGGGPNGAAIGPDGAVYIANDGGFDWIDLPNGDMFPHGIPSDYRGGSIQRVDLQSGKSSTIYTECDGRKLDGPNDLVFDAHGGFYFTDFGKSTDEWVHRGALFYAHADGSHIACVRTGVSQPNGIGISPDGGTVYSAEAFTTRLWAFDVESPGVLKPGPDRWTPGRHIWNAKGYQWLDSLAVEANGSVCVASVIKGGIAVISPDGAESHVSMPEFLITNICFGGEDMRTAWITAGASGKLYKARWPRPGLALNYNA